MVMKSITVKDIEDCGFEVTWTMLSLAVPYFISRTEAIDYAIDVCTRGNAYFPEIDFLVGLSADDIDEISETLDKLAKMEDIDKDNERAKLNAVILREELNTYPLKVSSVEDDCILKEDLIDLWRFLYCSKEGDLFFGKYDTSGILCEKYADLYNTVKKWNIDEIERLRQI